MTDKLALLEEVLEAMLTDDETITARAAVRRCSGVLKHATDITRNERRKALVDDYAKRQEKIRSAVERSTGLSRVELERQLAKKNTEIERLESEKELLIASHRAMILAVSEMGGFATWKRFFERHGAALDILEGMNALPRAEVLSHPGRERP
jgi:hypothetical protein